MRPTGGTGRDRAVCGIGRGRHCAIGVPRTVANGDINCNCVVGCAAGFVDAFDASDPPAVSAKIRNCNSQCVTGFHWELYEYNAPPSYVSPDTIRCWSCAPTGGRTTSANTSP